MTFERRLASEGSSSPPSLPYQLSNLPVESRRAARRYSTVDDTDGRWTQSALQHALLTLEVEPRSSPASLRGTPTGRNKRASKGTRGSKLAEVSVPGGRQGSKGSVDQGTEEDEDDDAMDVDEDDSKPISKNKGKGSKGGRAKGNTRRSGRKR